MFDLVDRFHKKSVFRNVCDFTLFVAAVALFTLLFIVSHDGEKPSRFAIVIKGFENKHNKEIREIQRKRDEASSRSIEVVHGGIFLLTFFGCWLFFILNYGLLLGLTLGLFAALIIATLASVIIVALINVLGTILFRLVFIIGFIILISKTFKTLKI